MQDRPTAAELLQTIGDLLERDVLPATVGPVQHQVRVAGNLSRILEREQALGPKLVENAERRLRELLPNASAEADLPRLYQALVDKLDEGADLAFEKRAWSALVEITRDKLAINKPGHDAYDFAEEVGGR